MNWNVVNYRSYYDEDPRATKKNIKKILKLAKKELRTKLRAGGTKTTFFAKVQVFGCGFFSSKGNCVQLQSRSKHLI